jgi:glycosyltransferase involved in cell wall biosynthesis
MKKKLAIINSDPYNFSYGGVAPFIKNMHPFLNQEFDIEYFFLTERYKKFPLLPGRLKIIFYLLLNKKRIQSFDFILSHIPEGSFVISFLSVPYAHIYHGNDNPMTQSRYWYGKYFTYIFDIIYKRIAKTAAIKYTVGPEQPGIPKILNPIHHQIMIKPIEKRSGFIFSGRLELIKNIDRIIQIYSRLPDRIKDDNDLYIAGEGTQLQNLRLLVSNLNLNEKVHFIGNLPNEQLIEEDSKRRILLMASTQEGLPMAIIEALSVGIPVVSTNPGDISRVLKNNYNGFIFPLTFDDNEYISAIITILNNYETFSRNAFESFLPYRAEIVTKKIIVDIKEHL